MSVTLGFFCDYYYYWDDTNFWFLCHFWLDGSLEKINHDPRTPRVENLDK